MRGEIYNRDWSHEPSEKEHQAALKRQYEAKMTKADILRSKRDSKNLPIKWTASEEKQLLDEFEKGLDLSIIAKSHGRSPNAIRLRLHRNGIKLPDEKYFRD